ncbi:hypothetical protein JX265_004189 [Neoarthrinium moseri]|uniref:Protein BIG1 n=1 Tax=Neoarthrinium moseri TaxID=1658444 RepID=A0A9P9WRN2_9PEZI|nr:hypothetical protein JX265_004189 [Neoarthrinium moseri]
MRLSVAAVAASCATAHAFVNTSPFILFSTSKITTSLSDELHSSKTVQADLDSIISSCPTERYLLVSQPNLNVANLAFSTAAPKLQAALAAPEVQGRLTISEVAGSPIDLHTLSPRIRAACTAAGKPTVSVETLDLEALPASGGSFQHIVDVLRVSDEDLGLVLHQYAAAGDFTVLYTAGSRTATGGHIEGKPYEAEFRDTTHQELKRQLSSIARRANETDNRPLFEKYQFFTPGIFMVLVSLLILFSILSVGISALGSLEVPYGAFDKENGPAAQKKQQ